jgi:DNA-binding NarL/FixJ family response regulator
MTVTVLLVDDHPVIRHGLRSLLSGIPDFQIIGEAGDGLEALREIELKKPNVLIVDMMMPNLNGLEVLSQMKKISPYTRTIVFSMQSAGPYVIEAIRAGAAGYVLKDTGPGEIVEAINSVMRGDRYLSPQLAERWEGSGHQVEDVPLELDQTLTRREREIIQMVAEGKSSTQIGDKLSISPRTVEVHRSNLMKKLALKNRAELIRYAIQHGILPPDG